MLRSEHELHETNDQVALAAVAFVDIGKECIKDARMERVRLCPQLLQPTVMCCRVDGGVITAI